MVDSPVLPVAAAESAEQELDRLVAPRRQQLAELRAAGVAFPNDFAVTTTASELQARYGHLDQAGVEEAAAEYTLAGRMMSQRLMGKLAFAHLQDRTGQLQILVRPADVGPEAFEQFRRFDLGDILGVRGKPTRTKAGELTLHVQEVRLLTKSLRPLPEKWHGLTDRESRYRQRYVDLIVNPETRAVFQKRSRIISDIRKFLEARSFVEVETPILQPQYGGAAARPFTTHHNALDTQLFMRIAPELYLKRLVVGGFDRVYEINKNFRNEGISVQHSPEFTMLEFYWGYATYRDLMDLTEELVAGLAREVCGTTRIQYQGQEIDLTPPWRRISVADAAVELGGLPREILGDREALAQRATALGLTVTPHMGPGKLGMELIDLLVEAQLQQPTFLTDFPLEVSPLSRRQEADPTLVDRFELYVAGRELANGFSELNDPEDQRSRFEAQVEARRLGDDEAPGMDEDYVRALEYGMPPTAGEGIGIDRLVMLLTDQPSIRDVVLFPLLRPREDL